MKKITSIVLLLLLLTGCSNYIKSNPVYPTGFITLQKQAIDYPVKKACYSAIDHTTYIWDTDYQIHIYHNKSKINTIGGKGLGRINFLMLTDICLYPDGDLLALDSINRTIKKFDHKGNLVSIINLSSEILPSLLCVSSQEKIFIYDNSRNQIIEINPQGYELQVFDCASTSSRAGLYTAGDYIYLYDEDAETTYLYDIYGADLGWESGFSFREKGGQYQCQDNYLRHQSTGNVILLNSLYWLMINYQAPEIVLFDGKYLLTGIIKYEAKK